MIGTCDQSISELKSKKGKEKLKKIPLGRIANPIEIANAVSYFVSDDSSYITGQTINLNGGMYCE